jgi:hypothetical protein
VNDTPRSTLPAPAVWRVLKVSPAGGVPAAVRSVMATSLLGSAPWSPPPLTVDAMAQTACAPGQHPAVGDAEVLYPPLTALAGRFAIRAAKTLTMPAMVVWPSTAACGPSGWEK